MASVSSQGRVSGPVALALARSLEVEGGGALPDGVVTRRIEKLRLALARAAGAGSEGEVHLLEGHAPRLQALPAGRIVVSRGLLAALSESDPRQPLVVAALAHEVAYSSLGYPQAEVLEAVRAAGHERLGAVVAPLVSGSVSLEDAASLGAARDAALDPSLRSVAGLERRAAADRLAARLLARLGYEPQALVAAWERLGALELSAPESLRSLVAGHGSCAERAESARAAARDLGRLPARRETPFELDLTRVVEADAERLLLEAAAPLAAAGRGADLERVLGAGEAAQRAEATWLRLRARREALRAGSEPAGEPELLALEAELRRLLLRDPLHVPARLLLAREYLARERPEAAAAELRELILRAPLWAEPHLLLARALASDPEPARERALLAAALDRPGGRVAAEARRLLSGEGEGGLQPPDPGRPRAGRSLLGGSR